MHAKSASTALTTDQAITAKPTLREWLKKNLTKEKLHRFIFGTREKEGAGKQLLVYALLIGIGFIYIYPILYMFCTSLMDQNDLLDSSVVWIPSKFYIQNYIDAGNSLNFWPSILKGTIIAMLPTVISVAVCMVIGYGFASFEFRGKKLLMALLVFTYILPSQVTMIPKYVLFNNLKMVGTLWSFILPSAFGHGLNSAIFILIFYQFFRQVPKVLIEAAQIDGAGYFKSFVRIAIPSAGPAILTVFLFCFVWYWNESYLTEMFVRGLSANSHWENLVIQLKNFDTSFQSKQSTGDVALSLNESVRMAATALSILPLLIMYFVLQRYFVESIDRAGITGE